MKFKIEPNKSLLIITVILFALALAGSVYSTIQEMTAEQGAITCAGEIKHIETKEEKEEARETEIVAEEPSQQVEEVDSEPVESVSLPADGLYYKTWTDYTVYTVQGTQQLEIQQAAWTDENGLRRYGNDYCVGVGSGIAEHIGDRFRVTLSNGTVFTFIQSDQKQDIHTDPTNKYGVGSMPNVLEFIVDTNVLDGRALISGDISSIPVFDGEIISIERI